MLVTVILIGCYCVPKIHLHPMLHNLTTSNHNPLTTPIHALRMTMHTLVDHPATHLGDRDG